jgi:hypothetical protein
MRAHGCYLTVKFPKFKVGDKPPAPPRSPLIGGATKQDSKSEFDQFCHDLRACGWSDPHCLPRTHERQDFKLTHSGKIADPREQGKDSMWGAGLHGKILDHFYRQAVPGLPGAVDLHRGTPEHCAAAVDERRSRRILRRAILHIGMGHCLRTVGAAKEMAAYLHSVSDDFAMAVFTYGCHGVDCTFEAIKNMPRTRRDHFEALIVFISADFALRHENCPFTAELDSQAIDDWAQLSCCPTTRSSHNQA